MPAARLSDDTAPDIERRQIERWRAMSPAEKAALIGGLSAAALDLAAAGVRHRYPGASAREQFLRRAIVLLGDDLARRVYPEVEALGDTR